MITRDTTLVLNAERANEPLVKSFVEELQRRLSHYAATQTAQGAPLQHITENYIAGSAFIADAEKSAVDGANGVNGNNGTIGSNDASVKVETEKARDARQAEEAAAMASCAREAAANEVPYELQVHPAFVQLVHPLLPLHGRARRLNARTAQAGQ